MNDDEIREFVDEWYYANVLPNPEFSIDDCVQMLKDFQAALLPRKESEGAPIGTRLKRKGTNESPRMV